MIQAADGVELYGCSFFADQSTGHLVIQHGLGEHGDRYRHLVAMFNNAGISVHLLDLRGHGRSKGVQGGGQSVLQLALDLEAFIEHLTVSSYIQGQPVLLGHSLGAVVTTTLALRHSNQFQLAGLAISAAPFQIPLSISQQVKQIAGRVLAKIAPNLILEAGLNAEDLSHDKSVVDAYLADPLVHGKLGVQLGMSLIECGQQLIDKAAQLKIPLWAAHGKDDKIASYQGTEQFFMRAGSEDKSLHIYDDLYHEIFNEYDTSPRQDLLDFVSDCLETSAGAG